MLTLTLIARLLVASSPDCYLVTSDEIRAIPCDFSAAATDALRYAADDAPEARARRARQQERDAVGPRRGPRSRTFRRFRAVED